MKKHTAALETRIQDLERKLHDAQSQLIHVLHFSCADLIKASTDKMQGSGVIITITALGGKPIIEPTCIVNGLSNATIQALRADMVRSFEYNTELKPKL